LVYITHADFFAVIVAYILIYNNHLQEPDLN